MGDTLQAGGIGIGRHSSTTTTESLLVFGAIGNLPTQPRHGIPVVVARDQRWFWTPEWLAGEHQASAEIAAGHVTTYADADDFLADLKAELA